MQQKTEYVNTNVILLILFVHIVSYYFISCFLPSLWSGTVMVGKNGLKPSQNIVKAYLKRNFRDP